MEALGPNWSFYYLHHLLRGPHSLIWRDVKRFTRTFKANENPHGRDIRYLSVWLLCGTLIRLRSVWRLLLVRGKDLGAKGNANYSAKRDFYKSFYYLLLKISVV